jgi:acetylornithine deacetylase/succinyl-diaminopimelate desuccinylase-like protein
MRDHGLATTLLRCGTGAVVGLTTEIRGSYPGPRWVLNACLDTAPFGDEHAWTHFPTSGVIENGWMWGRGSADSKVAVAIFCHLASRLTASTEQLHGSLVLLFDLDEHTGHFGGARQCFEGPDAPNDIAGVMIGYPGMDKLVIGARGVYRAELRVHGTLRGKQIIAERDRQGRAPHSGTASNRPARRHQRGLPTPGQADRDGYRRRARLLSDTRRLHPRHRLSHHAHFR